MTADEAIARARVVAGQRGWPWVEPAWAVRQRGGLLGLGRSSWRVISNARQNGDNAIVVIDERTGRTRAASFLAADAATGPAITAFRAIEIAREVAASESWPWREPVSVLQTLPARLTGQRHWSVKSNAATVGMNVSVVVDAATGDVLNRRYDPR